MKLIGVLVLPAAVVLAIAFREMPLSGGGSQSQARAKGVVWAGRTFVDRNQFARWLRSHGVRYRVWAVRHPELSGFKPRPRVARHVGRAAPSDAGGGRFRIVSTTTVALAGLAAVLCLALVLRRRRFALSGVRRLATAGKRARAGPRVLRPRAQREWAFATRLADVVERAPATTATAARLAVGRARPVASRSMMLATTGAWIVRSKRRELAWCLATALLAAGTGFLVTALLSGA